MSDKLKPCPSCGAKNTPECTLITELYDHDKYKYGKCFNCGIKIYDWNKRPIEDALQASIAELEAENAIFRAADYEALKNAEEKLIYCAKCMDGIVADDDGICGICANAQDGVIESLQNKVAELEKQAVVWHRFDIDDCNTYPECGMYLTLSIPERTEYREVDDESVYDVLWFELYSEEYWDKHNVTHWAYLPEPPEVKE